jgi:hypothetical protein
MNQQPALTGYYQTWIENPLQDKPIFMKTRATGADRFYKNQRVKFEIFKKLK